MIAKFFRHYKNKPYRFIGIVKHSESLEDLVLYETRYENKLSKLWVRPKEMFFENITLENSLEKKAQPRFQHIELKIQPIENVTDREIEQIAPLIRSIYGEWDPKWFYSIFDNHRKFFLLLARFENEIVGFKLGYEKTNLEFYSWLGGVLQDYRGLGVASELMRQQHQWCKSQGYRTISTKTQNRFSKMLILNIQAGFDIIGTHRSDSDQLKILLEKNLINDTKHDPIT